MKKTSYKKLKKAGISTPVIILLIVVAVFLHNRSKTQNKEPVTHPPYSDSVSSVEEFSGSPYAVINQGIPEFSEEMYTTTSYESYAPLDHLGRCGAAVACVGTDTMPKENRGDISSVKPSGWNNKPYDFVDGEYLYNRCHLIGFQLTGENANESNLITGTRYMNTQGMLPFENMVADYIKETGNHVLYRVTPIFNDDELVARGVQMEALSMEDSGEGIRFNIFAYNVQPGVVIAYTNGDNWLDATTHDGIEIEHTYVLNISSGKYHLKDCPQADSISANNRKTMIATRSFVSENGYKPAGCCDP